MAFRTNAAPYQRAKRSTLQIMIELLIALLIVWGAAVLFTFKEAPKYGVKSILMMLVALITTAACDVVTTVIKHKKGSKTPLGKEIVNDLIHNYSWITAVIYTLTLPVWASYYVVIIGSIFATVVVKNLFGGFGRNIFNPAIMARIFVGLCFTFELNGFAHSSVDATTGATIMTNFKNDLSWLNDLPIGSYSLKDLFLGNYFAAMGETFTLLILVLGIILAVRNVINWRTPVFYLGTVVVTALTISIFCGFENPLNYISYHLALGGLMFGAVFMITDPVTGPTSTFGKSFIGIIAGLLTVLIRVKCKAPEGVMYSIAICNLISPAIDYLTVGKTNCKLVTKYAVIAATLVVSVVLCTSVSCSVNGGKEVYSINGIQMSTYEQLTSQDFGKAGSKGFTLKDGHQLSIEGVSGNVSYYVVDAESKAKIAVAYKVKHVDGNNQDIITDIPEGEGHVKFTGNVYVVINIENGKLYDVAYEKIGTAAKYTGSVDEWANENLVGKDLAGIGSTQVVDGEINATFSARVLKELVEKAYALYALDYNK